jgi:hypothetical protein
LKTKRPHVRSAVPEMSDIRRQVERDEKPGATGGGGSFLRRSARLTIFPSISGRRQLGAGSFGCAAGEGLAARKTAFKRTAAKHTFLGFLNMRPLRRSSVRSSSRPVLFPEHQMGQKVACSDLPLAPLCGLRICPPLGSEGAVQLCSTIGIPEQPVGMLKPRAARATYEMCFPGSASERSEASE